MKGPAGDPGQIDTRSDVYALGVVLYELLSGRLPHDVRGKLVPEAVRAIREDDPPPLSTADRVFRGDLETIVHKALEKERSRRYGSAQELAADLSRYLRDEPILARPPSAFYQLAKFARRNRVLVAGAAAVLAVLQLGIIATSWQAARARRSEATALLLAASEAEQKGEALAARKKAEGEREKAETVNRFLTRLFSAINPYESAGRDAKVVDLLDEWEQELGESLRDQPEVEVPLRNALASAYLGLGLFEEAEKSVERARELASKALGEAHPAAREALFNRALLLQGRGKLVEAEAVFRRLLDDSLRLRGGESEESFIVRTRLASLLARRAQARESAAQLRLALDVGSSLSRTDEPPVMRGKADLAEMLGNLGELAAAERLLRENLAAWERKGAAGGLHAANTKVQIAYLLIRRKQFAEAETLARECLVTSERLLGKENRGTFKALRCLASALGGRGEFAEAEALLGRELTLLEAAADDPGAEKVRCLKFLGQLLSDQRRHDEAVKTFERAVEESKRRLGAEDRETLHVTHFLATALMGRGRLAEARKLYQEVLPKQDRLSGEEHGDTLEMRNNYGVLLQNMGDLPAAEAVFRRLLRLQGSTPEANVATFRLLHNLAFVVLAQGRAVEAEPFWRQAADVAVKVLPRGDAGLHATQQRLAKCLIILERYQEAEELLLRLLAEGSAALGADHAQVRQTAAQLAELYKAWGKPEEAAKYESPPPAPPQVHGGVHGSSASGV